MKAFRFGSDKIDNMYEKEGHPLGASIETLRIPGRGRPDVGRCRVLASAPYADYGASAGGTYDCAYRGRGGIAEAGRLAGCVAGSGSLTSSGHFAFARGSSIAGDQAWRIASRLSGSGCTVDSCSTECDPAWAGHGDDRVRPPIRPPLVRGTGQ